MKEQKLKTKKEKGITLIALIITIVVLLILALVSIGTIKDSGIIKHAQDASNDYTVAQEKEKIELALTEAYLAGNGTISEDNLKSAIESQLGEEITLTGSGNTGYIITTESGKQYSIKSNGNVNEYKEELERVYYVVDGAWVDGYVTSESDLPSGATITVKFYKTNNKFTPEASDEVFEDGLPEGYEYKLRISGQGNMPDVWVEDDNGIEVGAWWSDVLKLVQGESVDYHTLISFYVTEAVIEGVNNVPNNMFAWHEALNNCTLGSSVKTIGKYAFESTGLTNIDMGGVETVYQGSLANCKNLTYIKFGDNVRSLIGECTFEGCRNLVTVDLNNVSVIDGPTIFASCDKLKNIILRTESIEEINNSAFDYSNDATIYVLNESVKQTIINSCGNKYESRIVIKTLQEMDNIK